jgi:hypothetical protein
LKKETASARAAKISDLSQRLDSLSLDSREISFSKQAQPHDEYDDYYYIDNKIELPRFAYYRRVRIETCTDEWRKKTLMAAYDSITNDELAFCLKAELRRSPEQRYQERKEGWLFHDSNMHNPPGDDRVLGCTSVQCVPECRYYPQYGRIEDSEVIEEHNKQVQYYRDKNAIVDIDIIT